MKPDQFGTGLPMYSAALGTLPLVLIFGWLHQCEAVMECMAAGVKIDCFECNSDTDIRCLDPFNFTSQLADMPPRAECAGCCMKIVSRAGTPMENVRRTCTDKVDINLFMVGHVCMTEGGGNGHMCFCEEDDCNAANTISSAATLAVGLLLFILNTIF